VEPFDYFGKYGAMFEEPPARAASSTTRQSNSPLDNSHPRNGSEEPSLGERLFWPLLLCITYVCVAMLLGATLA
jgi:hypothetical protein